MVADFCKARFKGLLVALGVMLSAEANRCSIPANDNGQEGA